MSIDAVSTAWQLNRASSSPAEVLLTRVCLFFSLMAAGLYARDLLLGIKASPSVLIEGSVYALVTFFMLYGNFVYLLTRRAYLQRLESTPHRCATELELVHDQSAPSLLCLIPSYKEELRTIRQTLLSAALQHYPSRRVVLLIDDPVPTAADHEADASLRATRALVSGMDRQLAGAAGTFRQALDAFERRREQGCVSIHQEAEILSKLYREAARIVEQLIAETPLHDHTDQFFVDAVLSGPVREHQLRAEHWANRVKAEVHSVREPELCREYRRLATLFDVEVRSFERKAYANLSHESNKAMNLNTYIGLIGGSYVEEVVGGRTYLVPATEECAQLRVPAAKYILTLDADSLIVSDYALRLISLMEEPGNERIAVAQTPYSAIPGASSKLERIAGGTTDIQYLIHQGFTQHNATFWVGANAVLRLQALRDIAVECIENGHTVTRFIQDRTVIEDTESTIDLVQKGWTLYNYPARLAYSATPPDFGALVIQRARWANGGLIILPKLIRHILFGRPSLRRLQEGFFRLHYLTSIAGVNVGLLLLLMYPFPAALNSYWLPLSALPYFVLYARDLVHAGYRRPADVFRVYALNLLLVPVNMAGVMKSLQQAWSGEKIPFMRTPKVNGRTTTPARYLVATLALFAFCLAIGLFDLIFGRWLRGAFALTNAGLVFYAIREFVGWRELLEDLGIGMRRLPLPRLSGDDWARRQARDA